MSFCRITGKSRSLPKPNYFPIIPPISPDDAKRFCRITGKSYGLPSHHFIPVVLTSFALRKKMKCRVTNMAPFLERHHYQPDVHYGKRKHIVLLDYRYVMPVFNAECETQKELHLIFNGKEIIDNGNHFVYRVEEKQCNLVFPAILEEAIRDGDICDIMFAKDNDQILLRLKDGTNVSLDLADFMENLDELFEGEGPKEEVLIEREREMEQEKKTKKIAKHSRQQLKNITKIFEDKENAGDDDEEDETMKVSMKKKTKALKNVPKNVNKKDVSKIKKLLEKIAEDNSKPYQDLVKPMLESWDWNTYENAAKNIKKPKSVMTKKMKPAVVSPAKIKVSSRIKGFEKKLTLDNTIGFECIPLVGCYKKPDLKPFVQNLKQYQTASTEMMKKLENVVEKFQKADVDIASLLPSEDELFDVLQNITKGHKSELNGIPGKVIDIEDRRVFLPGEFILNEEGTEVFCPGQAVINDKGKRVFVCGLTTFDPMIGTSKGINFIAGQVMQSKDSQIHFQAGQIVNDQFICGQTIYVNDEPKFVEGQTIVTPEGFRFVAGMFDENNVLVPGKMMKLPNGQEKFVAGQMTEIFMPGQNVQISENEWKFVCGQTVVDENGLETFCPGKTIQTKEGSKFVAGQYNDDGVFVPGIIKKVGKEMKFIPGISIETKEGIQFVEGQMVESEEHGQIFMPGKTEVKQNGQVEFIVANSVDKIDFHAPPASGFVIDSHSLEVSEPNLAVFGHMVQTEFGIEFYPEKVGEETLPHGKMIPGRLLKQGKETKFVPGIIGDDGGFIPGQIVNTPNGEEFVPGQLVESAAGLKFVPGQVITLKNGEQKFVPGVTDKSGRFIPGQIIDTRVGPTFIPGQICYTEEEGERFVPGQIVDGCFVPGRIVETDDKVTFIAGQLVDTPEGFRFIAPDMKGMGEDFEFNLQGFSVTPEELELIKPQHNWASSLANPGELAIDSIMMKQLAAAGMSIGRQVESGGVDIVLPSTINREIVEKFCDEHNGISVDVAETIFKMIKQLTDDHREKINPQNMSQKILEFCMSMNPSLAGDDFEESEAIDQEIGKDGKKVVKKKKVVKRKGVTSSKENAMLSETDQIVKVFTKVMMEIFKNDEIDQNGSIISHQNGHVNGNGHHQKNKVESVYEIISNVLNESLKTINIEQLQKTFAAANTREIVLEKLSATINKVETLCKIEEMKQNLINATLGGGLSTQGGQIGSMENGTSEQSDKESELIVKQFCDIIDDEDMASAFGAITKKNPKLLMKVLDNITNDKDVKKGKVSVKQLIQNAIAQSMKEETKKEVDEVFAGKKLSKIKNLLNESLAIANALGLADEAASIIKAIKKTDKSKDGAQIDIDDAAKDVMQRVCIMKKLAEQNPDFLKALEDIQFAPKKAAKDNKVRELLRKSGLVSTPVAEKETIKSSKDIPPELMKEENILAMEEFLLKNGTGSNVYMVIKDGVKSIFPKEKSHEVLTGKIAYTIVDDNGVKHCEKYDNITINKVETLNKLEKMKTKINTADGAANSNENNILAEQFCDMIEDIDVASAFSAMSKSNPKLLMEIINTITNSEQITNKNVSMKQIVQNAIAEGIKQENTNKLDNFIKTQEITQIESLLKESLTLAKALGMSKESETILNAINKAHSSGDVSQLKLDDAAKSVIQRICVMKQLAEVDPDYQEALELLQKSPHQAVKDDIVRELVRKSGLVSIPMVEHQSIKSSKDIPAALMNEDNILAMEDYLLRNGTGSDTYLVIKDGVQCVIPKERSHDVMTGRCAYTVVDEDGIKHFEQYDNNTINKVETLSKLEELKQNLIIATTNAASVVQNGSAPQIMLNDNDMIVEQFCDIIDDLDVASAFSAMSKSNPKLLMEVLNSITNSKEITNENVSMKELIQNAIVEAVKQESNNQLDDFISKHEITEVESLLNESLILAKSLGMSKEAMTILSAIDKAHTTGDVKQIKLDDAAKGIIQRMCIMKKLAEVDPDYQEALDLLQQSPHSAVKDEIVRELVRKSGLISIPVAENHVIASSNDIPAALMNEENLMAMEDYLLRNGSGSKAFLIIKDGVQCVVPREKSHDVLTGKCAYTVLDENGIKHFEPLHVMNALNINTPTQHQRFSIYATDKDKMRQRQGSTTPTYDVQARDFQFSACDFADGMDSSEYDNSGDPSEFKDYFKKNINFTVDPETGYRRPRRRRFADKEDPTSNLDVQTTLMLNKRRGARPEPQKKGPPVTQVYRQYTQVNDNIYIMHAYVYHSAKKDKNANATAR